MATESDTVPDEGRNRYDVFISFSHKDEELVEKIKDALEGAGIKVWTDECIEASDMWLEEICNAVKRCTVVVFLLTENSVNSRFCVKEIMMAYANDKRILPISPQAFHDMNPILEKHAILSCVLCGIQWMFWPENETRQVQELIKLAQKVRSLIQNQTGCGETERNRVVENVASENFSAQKDPMRNQHAHDKTDKERNENRDSEDSSTEEDGEGYSGQARRVALSFSGCQISKVVVMSDSAEYNEIGPSPSSDGAQKTAKIIVSDGGDARVESSREPQDTPSQQAGKRSSQFDITHALLAFAVMVCFASVVVMLVKK